MACPALFLALCLVCDRIENELVVGRYANAKICFFWGLSVPARAWCVLKRQDDATRVCVCVRVCVRGDVLYYDGRSAVLCDRRPVRGIVCPPSRRA